jgi:hypothetical protein
LAQACATLTEFLAVTGSDFLTVGPTSSGTVTVDVQPAPGDTVTIANPYASPPLAEVYVADTDFAIGVDVNATAANLNTALTASALVDSYALANVVNLTSKTTGPASLLPISTSNATAFLLSGSTLEGGPRAADWSRRGRGRRAVVQED